ncbi:hypothetical protein QP938_06870 [Porticoccaceae bacterium LTM1]|nr:hypothetical protein QP938_06870 [Porticoccaceae bacterium LTM1]
MYTMENYFWGLVGYGLGGAVVMWYLFWLGRFVAWKYLRHGLLLLMATLIFTPVTVLTDGVHLAPAFTILVFEGLLGSEGSDPGRVVTPYIFTFCVFLVFYIGWQWLRHVWVAKKQVADKKEPMIDSQVE